MSEDCNTVTHPGFDRPLMGMPKLCRDTNRGRGHRCVMTTLHTGPCMNNAEWSALTYDERRRIDRHR